MTGPLLESPLVSSQWLADYLGSEKLVVLDATVLSIVQPNGKPGNVSGDESYLVHGHIPGALFADLIGAFSDPDSALPFTRPSAEHFAESAGALGIDNDSTVVIYDTALGQWAARLWWLFRAFGHERAAVLDGGYMKWLAENRGVDVGHVEPVPAVFHAVEKPERWASKAEVAAISKGEAAGTLVCGIPPKEFSGEEGSRARRGHIPGSQSVPVGRLIDRESNAFLPTPRLKESFGAAVGAPEERVVTYCNAGIAAAADALALTLAGHRNVALYDGSLNEWAADPDAALVTTA